MYAHKYVYYKAECITNSLTKEKALPPNILTHAF